MTETVNASAGAPRRAFKIESGEGRQIHVAGDEVCVKISSRDTGGAFAMMEICTPALSGPPLHRHRDQDEWWYIVEGDYRFEVDGREIHAGPGATVFAPRGSAHTFQNIGDTCGLTVVTVVPGGLDLFFEELETAAARGVALDPARVAPLFDKHALELLGPPLGARPTARAAATV